MNLRCTGHVTISIERGNDRPATVYALSSFRAKMTEVSGSSKFDEDLHQALEENLSLFPKVQLKAELNYVIVKLYRKRDVFGQLPTGYGNSLTFQQLPGVLKSLICWLF